MKRRGILLVCGVAVIVVAAAAYARESMAARKDGAAGLPGRMAGCWALYDGAGRPASDSLYFAAARVRLQTTRTSGRRVSSAAEPRWKIVRLDANGADVARTHDPSGELENWWYGGDGRIHVQFSSGFSGTEFILPSVRGDTLHGRAVEHWDFGPPFSTNGGKVTVVRIACS